VPTPDAVPINITAGPDGNLWFTEYNAGKIGRISTSGAITEFAPPNFPSASPTSIAAGPDGNVWYADYAGVGRVMPDGTISVFPVADNTNYPVHITAGPDGNIWYTQFYGTNIGVSTPSGVTSEKPVTNQTHPFIGITGGSADGNLWFLGGDNEVFRMTTGGSVTPFSIPTPNATAQTITPGTDGNLWLTEFQKIGRITPSGTITEFPVSNQTGVKITRGPDGNVWFTGQINSPQLGRVTPAGDITLIAVPNMGEGIAGGPDGNIWYTDSNRGKIVRFLLNP